MELSSAAVTDPSAEWLEADGLGGFGSGTVGGERRRRYHGLLSVALTPPAGRHQLVSGYDAWIEPIPNLPGRAANFLTRQRYHPDVFAGRLADIAAFSATPWPTWNFRLDDGTEVEHEVFVPKGQAIAVLRWRLVRAPGPRRLVVRPLLTGRDIHALHHENPEANLDARATATEVRWRLYRDLPAVLSWSNGTYQHAPVWYRGFQLDEERDRGFDYLEDAASPGELVFDLTATDALWVVGAEGQPRSSSLDDRGVAAVTEIRRRERIRRSRLGGPLEKAADAYLVARGTGTTVIAGYPWFTDWGRDTFISLRGLCLATDRLEDAKTILLAWTDVVSEGMLPNRFVDQGGAPEFNSVDASLWFVVVVGEFLAAYRDRGKRLGVKDRERLCGAVHAILEGYSRGTRFGIRADRDGLLMAGVPGLQLTWMDAKVGDWVVTPRIGKPVEVQALWINALGVGATFDARWRVLADRAREAFATRFWNPALGSLYDVVDVAGVEGTSDPAIRPNQIFAVGGLPLALVAGEMAGAVVDTVERELLTPLGLRSLSPDDPAYRARYRGGPVERDGAYHQGTVWPWLLGPFVEAWLRVRGHTPDRRAEARRRFVDPILEHLGSAGVGHVSEIADGDAPHRPNGCPFQAWSVGEALRLVRLTAVAGPSSPPAAKPPSARRPSKR